MLPLRSRRKIENASILWRDITKVEYSGWPLFWAKKTRTFQALSQPFCKPIAPQFSACEAALQCQVILYSSPVTAPFFT